MEKLLSHQLKKIQNKRIDELRQSVEQNDQMNNNFLSSDSSKNFHPELFHCVNKLQSLHKSGLIKQSPPLLIRINQILQSQLYDQIMPEDLNLLDQFNFLESIELSLQCDDTEIFYLAIQCLNYLCFISPSHSSMILNTRILFDILEKLPIHHKMLISKKNSSISLQDFDVSVLDLFSTLSEESPDLKSALIEIGLPNILFPLLNPDTPYEQMSNAIYILFNCSFSDILSDYKQSEKFLIHLVPFYRNMIKELKDPQTSHKRNQLCVKMFKLVNGALFELTKYHLAIYFLMHQTKSIPEPIFGYEYIKDFSFTYGIDPYSIIAVLHFIQDSNEEDVITLFSMIPIELILDAIHSEDSKITISAVQILSIGSRIVNNFADDLFSMGVAPLLNEMIDICSWTLIPHLIVLVTSLINFSSIDSNITIFLNEDLINKIGDCYESRIENCCGLFLINALQKLLGIAKTIKSPLEEVIQDVLEQTSFPVFNE